MSIPATRYCFVVMPFRPELNYFYLYIQHYLGDRHALRVERGDHRILTTPLLEKVRGDIQRADVIIGDITGRNPNVFYELGIADVSGKPVILITQDASEDVPTDVKHLEFIRYDLGKHFEFLPRLDNAIHNVFVSRYSALFAEAQLLLQRCNQAMGAAFEAASEEEFQGRVASVERIQGIPDPEDLIVRAEFLLPRVVRNTADVSVMKVLTQWLQLSFYNTPPNAA
jgi:hypothetical protein